MSIGIGLGAFMDGFKSGQDMRKRNDDAAYAKELRQRQTDEYNRQEESRKSLEAINEETSRTFDGLVATGEKKESDRADFWTQYALPKMHAEHLKRGDIDGASKLQAWGDTADAKRGARLSQSAILKIQQNDYSGALNDAMEVSKIKGYYNTEYTFTGHTPFVDETGKVLGYRLTGKDKDGKEFNQDVPLAKLPGMIATFTNPEAAWQSQQDAAAARAKDERELSVYDRKKAIDAKYSDNSKERSAAIKSLRDRYDGITTEGPKFDDMTADEKERLIGEELSLQHGGSVSSQPPASTSPSHAPGLAQPSAPQGSAPQAAPTAQPVRTGGRQVVFDQVTGKPVQPQQPAAQAAPSQPVQPQQPAAQAAPSQPVEQQDQRPQALGEPRKSDWQEKSYSIGRAEQDLANGVPPINVAMALRSAGIDEQYWPQAAKQDLANRRSGRPAPSNDGTEYVETGVDARQVVDRASEAAQSLAASAASAASSVKTSRPYSPQRAVEDLENGADPRQVAGALRASDVPETDWPEPVRADLEARRSGQQPGLGIRQAEETAVATRQDDEASHSVPRRTVYGDISGETIPAGERPIPMDVMRRGTDAAQPLDRRGATAEESAVATRQEPRKAAPKTARLKQDPQSKAIDKALNDHENDVPLGTIVRDLRKAGVQEKDWPKAILNEVKFIRSNAKSFQSKRQET